MRLKPMVCLALSIAAFCAFADDWVFSYRPASVQYAAYGNSLGDPTAPTRDDTKIAFEVTGRAAKDIFEAIGPDRKDQCSPDAGTRFRSRDEEKISCVRSNKGEYACHFGFDLKSGKSIGGSIC